MNNVGTCESWQQNINREAAVDIANLVRLIDLFNGGGFYSKWPAAYIAACPAGP